MARDIDNSMDIIDSRDVIARLKELDEWREAAIEHANELQKRIDELEAVAQSPGGGGGMSEELTLAEDEELGAAKSSLWDSEDNQTYGETSDWDEETAREWVILKALAAEGEGYGDWQHGETLIRDGHFEDYAQQFAEDIGAISSDAEWPLNHIDWEAAADELKQDYTSVDFDGVDYWMRS